jgi:hypothetical protein
VTVSRGQAAAENGIFAAGDRRPKTCLRDETYAQRRKSRPHQSRKTGRNIPAWCFGSEYQGCSPAHVTAGFTRAPDGRRMSIKVGTIGGSAMVQHNVETLGHKDHLILDSDSSLRRPAGRR